MRWMQLGLALGWVALWAVGCGGGGGGGDGPVQRYEISGRITGTAVERVLLRLGGDAALEVESDTFGSYFFPPLPWFGGFDGGVCGVDWPVVGV